MILEFKDLTNWIYGL